MMVSCSLATLTIYGVLNPGVIVSRRLIEARMLKSSAWTTLVSGFTCRDTLMKHHRSFLL